MTIQPKKFQARHAELGCPLGNESCKLSDFVNFAKWMGEGLQKV